MKKLLYLLLLLPVLIGCSSSNVQEQTIQMNDLKWTWQGKDSYKSESDVSKQLTLFDLVPGPQKLMVTVEKKPGETWYYFDLFLNVRLNRSVDIDLSKILADHNSKANAIECANIDIFLLDRNGERIQMNGPLGPYDSFFILFNERETFSDMFVDYMTFLQSDPGTVFTLHAEADFCDQKHECRVGLSNLIKEVKGFELEIQYPDSEFERCVGEIK